MAVTIVSVMKNPCTPTQYQTIERRYVAVLAQRVASGALGVTRCTQYMMWNQNWREGWPNSACALIWNEADADWLSAFKGTLMLIY